MLYSMYYLNHAYQRLFSFCHAELLEVSLLVEYHHNIVVFLQTGLKGSMLKRLGVHQRPFAKKREA